MKNDIYIYLILKLHSEKLYVCSKMSEDDATRDLVLKSYTSICKLCLDEIITFYVYFLVNTFHKTKPYIIYIIFYNNVHNAKYCNNFNRSCQHVVIFF